MLRIRRDNLEKERQDKARKEEERSKELEILYMRTQELGGLWKTPEEADDRLRKLSLGRRGGQKLKLEALKTQINFRKKNLRQPFPAKLGAFSQGGKAFSVEELTQKLKEIINLTVKE